MRIKKSTERKLLKKKNVVAVGWGYKFKGGKKTKVECVVCSVTKKVPDYLLAERDLVPTMVDVVMTDVFVTGEIKALAVDRTKRIRPAPGGVSIGHYAITAGTLGCLVEDRFGDVLILSNNHVLADSNDAEPGDPIYQPGPADGGSGEDRIAILDRFVPIVFQEDGDEGQCPIAMGFAAVGNALAALFGRKARLKVITTETNLVDAALAAPILDDVVSPEILDIGMIQGVAEATLGMKIKKSGRTTEVTNNQVLQVGVTVQVQYGAGKVATFRNQSFGGPMCEGGDSGSVILDSGNNIVGLLFAGSEQVTVFNRIQDVFSLLGVNSG